MTELLKRLREEDGYIEPGSGALVVQLLVTALAGLALFVLPLWGIIDAAIRPNADWDQADQSKIVWVLVQLFVPVVGLLAYFAVVRPKLIAGAGYEGGTQT